MVTRRYFLASAPAALPAIGSAARSRRRMLFVCLDGFGPEYLVRSDMPNLKRMGASGVSVTGRCVIPSVTNVNNASIATASLPSGHGITTNYFFNRYTGEGRFMESAGFLLRPTIFERARKRGLKTALVTSKGKLLTLISRGAGIAVAAESPAPEFIAKIGPKEDMYSAAVNYWSFRAARHILKERGVDLLYLTTTDYMMHTYPPEDPRSLEHLHTIDRLLGEIVDDHPNLEVYLSADHGMNAKTEAIDLARVLAKKGIAAEAVPIVKDKHVAHHSNLGGACYVYVKRGADIPAAGDILRSVRGVEELVPNAEAAARFGLMASRIGDFLALGEKHIAFGSLDNEREATRVRTHGGLHEQAVPVICYGRKVEKSKYERNLDITRRLVWPG